MRESEPPRASRALKRALDPAVRDFRLRACDVRAPTIILCAPNEYPGSAPKALMI